MPKFSLLVLLGRSSFVLFALFLNSNTLLADVFVDIRASSPLVEEQLTNNYAARISDCSNIYSLDVTAGAYSKSFPIADVTRLAGSATGCEFFFDGSGVGALSPQIVIN